MSHLKDLKKAMEILSLTQQGAVKTTEDAMAKQYEFWSTQPVPMISMFILLVKQKSKI